MENHFSNERYQKCLKLFESKTDYEIVNVFNKESSHNGWVGARGDYLEALKQTFINRNIDIKAISTTNTFSLKYQIYLAFRDNKKVVIPIIRE